MALIPKDRYPGQTVSGDANYPHGKARNRVTPGDGTGTPWEEDLVNDWFGFFQALLAAGFVAPNGAPDSASSSQYLEALEKVASLSEGRFAILNHVRRTAGSSYSGSFQAVAYGNGLFVTVGESGGIQTSPDGITWTQRTAASSYTGTFRGVCWSQSIGLFVAVGDSAEIQTSPGGTTWTRRTPGGAYSGNLRSVAWSEGLGRLVAVGSDGGIQTSTNGTSWIHVTPAPGSYSGVYRSVVFGGSLFVAVGDSAAIHTSPDGLSWSAQAAAGGYGGAFVAVGHGGSRYIAVGANDEVQYSSDAVTWTSNQTPVSVQLSGIAYGGDLFVLTSPSGALFTSTDGRTWKNLTRPSFSAALNAVTYGFETFMLCGDAGTLRQTLVVA